MAKTGTRNIGTKIFKGVRKTKPSEAVRAVTSPPVAATRTRIGLSQSEFARLLGVSVRTLQEWEQGRRVPSGPARMLLAVAHKNPRALLEAAV